MKKKDKQNNYYVTFLTTQLGQGAISNRKFDVNGCS